MKHKTIQSVLLSGILLITCSSSHAKTLLYEYTFNNNKDNLTTQSTGSEDLTLKFSAYSKETGVREHVDLYGDNASGVSGKADDLALNNQSQFHSNGMAQASKASDAIKGLKSITFSGWYKASNGEGTAPRLIEIGRAVLFFNGKTNSNLPPFKFSTRINDPEGKAEDIDSSSPTLVTTGQWVFFAVTYDGDTGACAIYGGSESAKADLIEMKVLDSGVIMPDVGKSFTIGNSSYHDNERAFNGLLDNFRIWGSVDDSTGALTLNEIKAVQTADLKNESLK